MKVLLKDNKADFVLELLGSLKYVKTKKISAKKERFLNELREAVENVNLAKAGKLKTKSLKLLDEL